MLNVLFGKLMGFMLSLVVIIVVIQCTIGIDEAVHMFIQAKQTLNMLQSMPSGPEALQSILENH